MIQSKYINDIVNLLLDSDQEGLFARQQIPFLTDARYDYTGDGLFVSFEHSTGIEQYRMNSQSLILDGVKIQSKRDRIEAQAILFFKHGLIDNLEIWCYEGDYPERELTGYVLTQTWFGSGDKIFVREE